MNKIINMTPHSINVMNQNGESILIIQPSGNLIRLAQKTETVGEINGIPLTKNTFGEPEGLPEYEEGTYYIVSALLKTALPERKDLIVPSEPVRDEAGRIIGCRSFGIQNQQ